MVFSAVSVCSFFCFYLRLCFLLLFLSVIYDDDAIPFSIFDTARRWGRLLECILLTGLTVNTLCARLGSRSTQQLRTIPHELPKWTELSHSVLCQWNVTLAMSRQSSLANHTQLSHGSHTLSLSLSHSPLLSLMSTAGGTFGNEHLSCVWVLAEPRRPIAMRSNKLRVVAACATCCVYVLQAACDKRKPVWVCCEGWATCAGNMHWQHFGSNLTASKRG